MAGTWASAGGARDRRRGRRVAVASALALAAFLPVASDARADVAAREAAQATLLVGTSGDYAPFSFDPAGAAPPEGFDVALAERFAADTGRRIELVPFRWPELTTRLSEGAFALAASGVTVRPERSLAGTFSQPLVESGAVVLVVPGAAAGGLDALDRPEIRLAVNAGGHLERAARARFPRATILPMAENARVPDEVIAGRAEAAVTDTLEAAAWEKRAPGLVRLGPFTRDRKAWLLRDDPALAAEVEAWIAAREADGSLGALRARWLPPDAAGRAADPLPALVAAIDERLALMPYVAEAKRAAGRPVRDPAQEARVLDAAVAAAGAEGAAGVSESCVRGLFSAQIEAASALQEAILAKPPVTAEPPPDLAATTRPALARVGARITRGLARLPRGLSPGDVRAAVREGVRTPGVRDADRDALSEAIVRCTRDAAA